MLEVSDADSSATGPQVDACGPSMTGSNPSSETYQDGQGKVSKNSGASKANRPKLPRPEGPPPQCPRCNADTSNTKFCYYNNYNINQPRYYCKACQRHWTDGGTLRKVETGAGKRNSRRQRSHSTAGGEAAANSKAPKTRGGSLHQQVAHGAAPATRRSAAAATVASDMPSGPLMDSMMPDYNSSEAGASFQEGSSFNDKMLLDDECQAIADLDVIFENERLDAILGSSNTLPVETDRPLQQMLGLDALEDLPSMSEGEADFQQAMMEGCPSNPDAGQLLLSAGGMSTPGTSQGGPLLVADASGPLHTSFGDDETASRGPPSPKAVSHTGSPQLHAGGAANTIVNVDAAFRTHIQDPSPATAQHVIQPLQHMMPAIMPVQAVGQAQPQPALLPVGPCEPKWAEGAQLSREGTEDATLATSSNPAQVPPTAGAEMTQSSTPQTTASNGAILAAGQQWGAGSMPMPGPQYAIRPGMQGAPGGAVLVSGSMQPGNGGMMAYPVNMGMHAGRIMQAPRVAAGSNGVYTIQATSLQGYMGVRPGGPAQQGHMPTPQYYVMPYAHPPRASMPAHAHASPPPKTAPAAVSSPLPAASAPQPASQPAADAVQASSSPVTAEAGQPTANQIYAMDHNRQLLLRHQRMYSTTDPAAASGGTSAKATASPQQKFVPVAAHHLQGRIYVRPPEATGGRAGGGNASPPAVSAQPAAATQEAPAVPHAAPVPATRPGEAVPTGAAAASGAVSASAARSGSSSQTQLYATEYRQARGAPGAKTAVPAVQGTAQHAQQISGFQGPLFCMAPGQWQHGGRPVFTLQPYYVQPGGYVNGGGHMYASAPMQLQPQMQQPQTVANSEGMVAGSSMTMKEEPAM